MAPSSLSSISPQPHSSFLPSSSSTSSLSSRLASTSISPVASGSRSPPRRASSPRAAGEGHATLEVELRRGSEPLSGAPSGESRSPAAGSQASRSAMLSPTRPGSMRIQVRPSSSYSSPHSPSSPTGSSRRPSTSSGIPVRSPKLRPRRPSSNSISPAGSSSSTVTLKSPLKTQHTSDLRSAADVDELGFGRKSSQGSDTAVIGLGNRRRVSGQPNADPSYHKRPSYSMTTSISPPGGPDGPLGLTTPLGNLSRSSTEPNIASAERATTPPTTPPVITSRRSSMNAPVIYAPYDGLLNRPSAESSDLGSDASSTGRSEGKMSRSPANSPRAGLRIIPPQSPASLASMVRPNGDQILSIQDSAARDKLLGEPSPPIPAKNPLRGLLRSEARSRTVSGESQTSNGGRQTSSASALSSPSPSEQHRYSTITQGSIYSQPSAPNTASTQTAFWPSDISPDQSAPTSASLRGVTWGNRRGTIRQHDLSNVAGNFVTALENTIDKDLPSPPPASGTPKPLLPPRSPVIPSEFPPTPPSAASKPRLEHRSPVSPIDTVKANRTRARSRSNPTSPLVPLAVRSLGNEASGRPPLPRSPSTSLPSKRAHLIHEICSTEQSYASEMALVRDAYMLRFLRPASQYSHATSGGAADASNSPGAFSDRSRRSSLFTYETADTRGTSVQDLGSSGNSVYPMSKSPSGMTSGEVMSPNGTHSGSSYFPSPVMSTPPVGSLGSMSTPQPSPRTSSLPQSAWNPRSTSGTILSTNDMRAVFLNLEQIAAFADELALAFEEAAGEEMGGPGAVAREGEGGTDKLGAAFLAVVPRLQSLYTVYCGRQAQANSRLVELLADPAHAAHLAECWALVQPHTNAWDLGSMLIKPVQRVLKYPLLFADLLACTSPVHPDYFNLRKASESARAVADEINEVKRRKDVVERVMAGSQKKREVSTSSVASKDSKASGGGLSLAGLKRFRKDKSLSLPGNSSNADLSNPTMISPRGHAQLRELTTKMEDCERAVRRIGTEVVKWVKCAEATLLTEDSMMNVWTHVYQLDAADMPDERILAFRKTLQGMSRRSHAGLAREVETKVMPIFSKLLLIAINPRAVIAKKDHKTLDYNRFTTLREHGKNVDKQLSQAAHDFVALHTQLLEELPTFLEGYMQILDLALVAWAQAQARYHAAIRGDLQAFASQWLPSVPSRSGMSPGGGMNLVDDDDDAEPSLDGRAVVKVWHEAWQPYAEALDRFECTRHAPSRVASRMANFRIDGTVSRTSSINSASNSRAASPSPAAARMLRHSSSISSSSSTTWRHSRGQSGAASPAPSNQVVAQAPRKRSASLMAPAQTVPQQGNPLSPVKADTRYGLLRRTNSKQTMPRSQELAGARSPMGSMGPPPVPTRSQTSSASSSASASPRDSTLNVTTNTARYSFGLPLLTVEATQPLFDGIGESPPTLGGSQLRTPTRLASQDHLDFSSSHPYASGRGSVSSTTSSIGENAGLGYGNLGEPFELQTTPKATPSAQVPEIEYSIDPADGWRDEPVLYQCACVANFAPVEERRYRALRFLPMEIGDLINVLYEVGRIDELEGFPFPTIGVEDDGLLVGSAEDGSIGLVICSFLEPLRD